MEEMETQFSIRMWVEFLERSEFVLPKKIGQNSEAVCSRWTLWTLAGRLAGKTGVGKLLGMWPSFSSFSHQRGHVSSTKGDLVGSRYDVLMTFFRQVFQWRALDWSRDRRHGGSLLVLPGASWLILFVERTLCTLWQAGSTPVRQYKAPCQKPFSAAIDSSSQDLTFISFRSFSFWKSMED